MDQKIRSSKSTARMKGRPPTASKLRLSQDDFRKPFIPREVTLVSNAYTLTKTKNDLLIYEYKIILTIAQGFDSASSKVLSRNFVSKSIRKLIMEKLVPQLVGCPPSKSSVVVDYNLEALYSSVYFKTNNLEPKAPENLSNSDCFIFRNILVETDLLNRLRVDIVVKYSRSFQAGSFKDNNHLLTSVLHHQLLLSMIKYGAVYFVEHDNGTEDALQKSRLDLISQYIMGISVSGVKRTTSDLNFVVISCPHAYITGPHQLIDLLATFIQCKPVHGTKLMHNLSDEKFAVCQRIPEIDSIVGNESWFESFSSILNGFKCQAQEPERHTNLRFSLTDDSAANLKMPDPSTKKPITVQDYYKQLGINLNYPNLPCLKSRSNRHPFYPLEMCSLISGQKVPIFRLSTAARNHLNLLNKLKPDKSRRLNSRARDNLALINDAQFETFGLKLDKSPVSAIGSILQKPTLQFRNGEVEPCRDFWESGIFYHAKHLVDNWCVVDTISVDHARQTNFFNEFSLYCRKFGFRLKCPCFIDKPKQDILDKKVSIEVLIEECRLITNGKLKFIMFVIDSSSTPLNRLIHLSFDEHPMVTATCLRVESIMNHRQQRSIFRTLVHKLNTRLGGTNVTYNNRTLERLSLCCNDLMIIGLDVTHPDNELSGVSIVGCAYTYDSDLFKHRSLVWPQTARVEIIGRMDVLITRLLNEYSIENKGRFPKHVIVYRDGVSHEDFEKVRSSEVSKIQMVLEEICTQPDEQKPILSYVIAQKRHTMRFFLLDTNDSASNPPSGTLIGRDVVAKSGKEFYLYSNTSPQATARPLHYHVILDGLGIEDLQKLTYFLCFNFGKCSGTLSMPSSLKYAHNAAYDARNRVIAAKEFSETRFYASKFFC